jgi:hypothetical protein
MDRSINLIATNVTIHIIKKYSSNLEWPNLFMRTGLEYLFEPFTYIYNQRLGRLYL